MMAAAGIEVPIEHAPERPGELRASALRIDKAAAVLGWKPSVALAEGLRRTYEWIAGGGA
jgi:UDP-glucose 4-epimerase